MRAVGQLALLGVALLPFVVVALWVRWTPLPEDRYKVRFRDLAHDCGDRVMNPGVAVYECRRHQGHEGRHEDGIGHTWA